MSRTWGKTKDQSENNNSQTTARQQGFRRASKTFKRIHQQLTWRLDQFLVVDVLLRVAEHALEPVVLDVVCVGEDVGVVALPLAQQVEAVQVGAAPPAPALAVKN